MTIQHLLVLDHSGEEMFSLLPYSVALQSLEDLGRLTYGRFLNLFRNLVGLLGRRISLSRGLYLYRAAQHRKTRTNIHTSSGIRTHDPSVRAIKDHAPGRVATATGNMFSFSDLIVGFVQAAYLN
jgi:hypothetical protein